MRGVGIQRERERKREKDGEREGEKEREGYVGQVSVLIELGFITELWPVSTSLLGCA